MKFQHNKVWRWYANRNIMTQKVDLYWMGEGTNGESYHRAFTTVEESCIEPGAIMSPDVPTLALDYDQADTLMQEMWNAGIRPKGVQTGQAHVDALHKHLDSLQKTVDHFMDMNSLPQMMEIPVGSIEQSPFDKLNTDFGTLWNKVEALNSTVGKIVENLQVTQKIAESLQNDEKKI
jgi:hypothetical protein